MTDTLVHRWFLVHVWTLWCLPASSASGFRFQISDVAKKRLKLWVRLEMGWCLMTGFPGNTRTAATRMNNTPLGCSRLWQSAGSSDLSYMHMIKLVVVSWPRRCCALSSNHDNPMLAHILYPHVPAFRVMTSCGKLSRCLGHHTLVFVNEVVGWCKCVHGLGSTTY